MCSVTYHPPGISVRWVNIPQVIVVHFVTASSFVLVSCATFMGPFSQLVQAVHSDVWIQQGV